ncbi:hypothetical protein [Riemerella anatipestifer]|uniref:hypothetical protein n=1 Tax=Riemerella anatipestifer TaxID=34085 RepID=UPI00129EEFE3|nr:hypothetical protein [Riemerella anatipestifer]
MKKAREKEELEKEVSKNFGISIIVGIITVFFTVICYCRIFPDNMFCTFLDICSFKIK